MSLHSSDPKRLDLVTAKYIVSEPALAGFCGLQGADREKEGPDDPDRHQVVLAARLGPHRLNVLSGLTHTVSESQRPQANNSPHLDPDSPDLSNGNRLLGRA